jgi:hypothetical protein
VQIKLVKGIIFRGKGARHMLFAFYTNQKICKNPQDWHTFDTEVDTEKNKHTLKSDEY